MSAPVKKLEIPVTGEHRAVTPAAEGWVRRADLFVVVGALALLAGGWFLHGALTKPRLVAFESGALSLRYPADFALREPLVVPKTLPVRVAFRRPGEAASRIEISVEKRRAMLGDAAAGRELERAQRHGAHYERRETGRRSVGGHDWLRTRYSFVSSEAGGPAVIQAVEYAYPTDPSVNSEQSYIVTVYGTEAGIGALESSILGSLRVAR